MSVAVALLPFAQLSIVFKTTLLLVLLLCAGTVRMAATKKQLSFADLPYDLREMIWQLCLPHRVYEVDFLWDEMMWYAMNSESSRDQHGEVYPPPSCYLWDVGSGNSRPPMITQVCREARDVARKALSASQNSTEDCLEGVRWHLDQHWNASRWKDRARDTPHLYYDNSFDTYCYGRHAGSDPLAHLADMVTFCGSKRGASLMITHLQKSLNKPDIPDDPDRPNDQDIPIASLTMPTDYDPTGRHDKEDFHAVFEDSRALERCQRWQVVMGVVVVHCNPRRAGGYFGLLCDAPIQILDIATDQDRIASLARFAETCEAEIGSTAPKQDFACTRTSLEVMRHRLEYILWTNGFPSHLYKRIHPSIMFRLCPHACHLHDPAGSRCTSSCVLP